MDRCRETKPQEGARLRSNFLFRSELCEAHSSGTLQNRTEPAYSCFATNLLSKLHS
jgi:hypothetical protein